MALDLNSLILFRKHAGGPAGLSTPRAGLAVKAVDACVCVYVIWNRQIADRGR